MSTFEQSSTLLGNSLDIQSNVSLRLAIGEFSDSGPKPINQDFHGAIQSPEPQLSLKGNAVALADGISSSDVSHIASETAVKTFLHDYFCTSDAWSVKTAGLKVLASINGWLHAQNQQREYRLNPDKGLVCTFSGIVFKASTAHVFHIGDSRIYRIRGQALEQLTKDHRGWLSSEQSYLSKALGINHSLALDYQALELAVDDIFLLCTDGIFEYCSTESILCHLAEHKNDLPQAANAIGQQALANGSDDNITVQIVKVEQLPQKLTSMMQAQLDELQLPPLLSPRQEFDGYLIMRETYASSRSHVYLAKDIETGQQCTIKIPSFELRENAEYLERFLMEEWVARRINSAYVMKAQLQQRSRNYLYTVSEYIEGVTLSQWLIDHPTPNLANVREIIEQIAKGLMALHRLEILHQDLRPENIMIDHTGTVKIIDFGGVRVAGIVEAKSARQKDDMQGTALYMAPEYFVGEPVSALSDQFSLAMIAYHMLSNRFAYGTQVAKLDTHAAQRRLVYQSVLDDKRAIPAWVDYALRKALQPTPEKRYEQLSEFIHDLSNPNPQFMRQARAPLIERNPLKFWKGLSFILATSVFGLLIYIEQLTR
ncbi:bifunctional protein-serine/threonine kinase/phosphatase [Thalassotalea euphylliae]|uniref:bifunctional protein-serine/threonine kinase/phosphatase n=1 Tax=Thalassotalea euphylliae TaxID=1655234 RepID=UPI001FEA6CC7|nr:bifunctional protein-serine/threonine kinase/phosphatase [Thalassotalea euphylliae]